MSKALTVNQFKETYPDAFAKIQAVINEFHDKYLDQYMEKYGPEPPDKLLDLHIRFFENNGALTAIEPRGGLLRWNPNSSDWFVKGDISVN